MAKITSMLLKPPLPRSLVQLGRFVPDVLYPDVDFLQPESFVIPPTDDDDGRGEFEGVINGTLSLPPTVAAVEDEDDGKKRRRQQQQQSITSTAHTRQGSTGASVSGGSGPAPAPAPAATLAVPILVRRLEDVSQQLASVRGTRLETALAGIFSASWAVAAHSSSRTTVAAPLCTVRELRDPAAYFRAACRDEGVRAWLERQGRQRRGRGGGPGRRRRQGVYLICGYKTFTDGRVEREDRVGTGFRPEVVVGSGGGGGGWMPTIASEFRAGAEVSGEESGRAAYTAPGEQVYAVQFRQVRFSFFFLARGVDVERAGLDGETRWKSLLDVRGGEEGSEVVGVELAEEVDLDDLEGLYAYFERGKEGVLVNVVGDVGGPPA